MTRSAHIPPDAVKFGPGCYGTKDGMHIDLDEMIRETGGDPSNPAHRAAAERAVRRVSDEQGIPVEEREHD